VEVGGTLTVCRAAMRTQKQGGERAQVATMLATMVRRRAD
jgi:hypothetical protein